MLRLQDSGNLVFLFCFLIMPSRVREQAGHVPASYFQVVPNRFNIEAVTTNTLIEGDAMANPAPVELFILLYINQRYSLYIYIYKKYFV